MPAGHNRINSISGALARTYSYDAVGNAVSYTTISAAYNNRGRLKTLGNSATSAAAVYVYNALGQLAKQSGGPSGTKHYVYDEAGHLLGEYDGVGNLVQETVWLGDIPVATLRPSGAGVSIYYVHSDHLNTPRVVTRPSDGAEVWRWDSDAFGTVAANENPSSLGTFAYNLRFPGQVFDGTAGLHQNMFRDYSPAIGKYAESDPIGIDGGIDTYAYAYDNPISLSDPYGLRPLSECEKAVLRPFIPDVDLNNADLHDGTVPWYLGSRFDGITRGNDIYFRRGAYDAGTTAGLAILGHELVHVGQYRQGMNLLKYILSSMRGYGNNKYELPAYEKQIDIQKALDEAKSKGCDPCKM